MSPVALQPLAADFKPECPSSSSVIVRVRAGNDPSVGIRAASTISTSETGLSRRINHDARQDDDVVGGLVTSRSDVLARGAQQPFGLILVLVALGFSRRPAIGGRRLRPGLPSAVQKTQPP